MQLSKNVFFLPQSPLIPQGATLDRVGDGCPPGVRRSG
jgi:hypothetical protein